MITCRSRWPSPHTAGVEFAPECRRSSSSPLLWARSARISTASSTMSRRLNEPRFEFELAGFDLGEIEDVIDDIEQRAAGLVDGVGIAALAVIQAGRMAQQLRHAEHAVHRRADLMAHARQELALGAAGAFGALERLAVPRPPPHPAARCVRAPASPARSDRPAAFRSRRSSSASISLKPSIRAPKSSSVCFSARIEKFLLSRTLRDHPQPARAIGCGNERAAGGIDST